MKKDARGVVKGASHLIEKEKMFVPMLEACPEVGPLWEIFVEEWSDYDDGLPMYLFMGDFVRFCVAIYEDGNTMSLIKIFAVVERWLIEGDAYVSEAAIVGFLETLQNDGLHSATQPSDFMPFLGAEGRYWWGKVEAFWEKGEPLIDDRQK